MHPPNTPFIVCTLLHICCIQCKPRQPPCFQKDNPKIKPLRYPQHPCRSHIWVSAVFSWKLPSFYCLQSKSGLMYLLWPWFVEPSFSKYLQVSGISHVSYSFRWDFSIFLPQSYPWISPALPAHILEQFFTCKIQKCLECVSTSPQPHPELFGAYMVIGKDRDTH